MIIEMGQYYRNKRDEAVCITGTVGPDRMWDQKCGMRFTDNIGRSYRPDGTYNNIPGDHILDLVEHITDPKELVTILNKRIADIYDADRDYDICLADLPQETQDKYNALRQQRNALL